MDAALKTLLTEVKFIRLRCRLSRGLEILENIVLLCTRQWGWIKTEDFEND